MKRKTKEVPIQLVCEKVCNPRPWNYEAFMVVFGKRRFLTFGDTVKDVEKRALRRLKTLLLKKE